MPHFPPPTPLSSTLSPLPSLPLAVWRTWAAPCFAPSNRKASARGIDSSAHIFSAMNERSASYGAPSSRWFVGFGSAASAASLSPSRAVGAAGPRSSSDAT